MGLCHKCGQSKRTRTTIGGMQVCKNCDRSERYTKRHEKEQTERFFGEKEESRKKWNTLFWYVFWLAICAFVIIIASTY